MTTFLTIENNNPKDHSEPPVKRMTWDSNPSSCNVSIYFIQFHPYLSIFIHFLYHIHFDPFSSSFVYCRSFLSILFHFILSSFIRCHPFPSHPLPYIFIHFLHCYPISSPFINFHLFDIFQSI